MGSRMMHLIIADQVSKQLAIDNKQTFLLGGIAPDAAFSRERKTASHFYEGSLEDGTRSVSYHQFIAKYPVDIQRDYGLGYLTHLVSDDVWMKEIYFKNDFKPRIDADPGLLERWHSDFRKLNGMLVDCFDCGNLRQELLDSEFVKNDITEIQMADLQLFKEETLKDFESKQEISLQELQVYTLQQILDYIDFSTSEAIRICQSVQKSL
ncbi:hypothetical protein [Planococcus shixiaomingii]|uniref:hypothetical protein n=1 Tax=Planococcus shixiaomingii TaxID=3058393 RepID=UPI002618A814|nr:hypothetical protein [Planococcus sp. N022]WKA53132.1 hypothetical protein QWY21_10705 [Planococcus sp. N022]